MSNFIEDFDPDKTYICGILNVTPDSFNDGGKYLSEKRALERVEQMIKEGADMIDIGAESTRPGYTPVSADEQISRLKNILPEIVKQYNIPLSIDTTDSRVAEYALENGCCMLNDISGLTNDYNMACVVAGKGAYCVITHNNSNKHSDIITGITEDFKILIDKACEAGIKRERIILDPGIGFNKTYSENLCILNNLECFKSLGFPVYVGASQKSVIGLTLNLPVEDRLEGTIATTVIATMKKASFIRVHDVLANKRAMLMTKAIKESKRG